MLAFLINLWATSLFNCGISVVACSKPLCFHIWTLIVRVNMFKYCSRSLTFCVHFVLMKFHAVRGTLFFCLVYLSGQRNWADNMCILELLCLSCSLYLFPLSLLPSLHPVWACETFSGLDIHPLLQTSTGKTSGINPAGDLTLFLWWHNLFKHMHTQKYRHWHIRKFLYSVVPEHYSGWIWMYIYTNTYHIWIYILLYKIVHWRKTHHSSRAHMAVLLESFLGYIQPTKAQTNHSPQWDNVGSGKPFIQWGHLSSRLPQAVNKLWLFSCNKSGTKDISKSGDYRSWQPKTLLSCSFFSYYFLCSHLICL